MQFSLFFPSVSPKSVPTDLTAHQNLPSPERSCHTPNAPKMLLLGMPCPLKISVKIKVGTSKTSPPDSYVSVNRLNTEITLKTFPDWLPAG